MEASEGTGAEKTGQVERDDLAAQTSTTQPAPDTRPPEEKPDPQSESSDDDQND